MTRTLISIAFVLAVACSPSMPSVPMCDATTCGGCCTSEGRCEPGTSASACGVNGTTCDVCVASQQCGAGTCTTGSGSGGGSGGGTGGGSGGGNSTSKGWTWESATPQGNDLTAVWAASPTDQWAVGEVGTLVHFDGTAWTPSQHGEKALRAIWGSSANDVWAGGDEGSLIRFDGSKWSNVASGTTSTITSLWGAAANDVWAVASFDVLHFDGTAWTKSKSVTCGPGALGGSGPADVWLVTACGQIWRWNGSQWGEAVVPSMTPGLSAVWARSPTEAWAVGKGLVLTWNGTTWAKPSLNSKLDLSIFPSDDFTAVRGDATRVWVIGGSALRLDVSGWQRMFSLDAVQAARALWTLPNGTATGVGKRGAIVRFDGTQWAPATQPVVLPDYKSIYAVWGSSPDDVWAASSGVMYRRKAGAWAAVATSTTELLFAIGGSGPNDVWASGYMGALIHWNGTEWTSVASGTTQTIDGLWASGPNDVWATTDTGMLHWNGNAWNPSTLPDMGAAAVWGSSAGNVFAAGGSYDEPRIARWSGSAWNPMTLPASLPKKNLTALWGFGPNDVWAAGYGGLLIHFDGTAWTRFESWTQASFVGVWGAKPNDVWAAGRNGELVHYDGTSWTLTPKLTHRYLDGFGGGNSGAPYLVGEYGTIIRGP